MNTKLKNIFEWFYYIGARSRYVQKCTIEDLESSIRLFEALSENDTDIRRKEGMQKVIRIHLELLAEARKTKVMPKLTQLIVKSGLAVVDFHYEYNNENDRD